MPRFRWANTEDEVADFIEAIQIVAFAVRKREADMTNERVLQISRVFLRLALGITFLVSIADRFGWLGRPASKNVSWGDWKHFVFSFRTNPSAATIG